jgi:CRISPR-associated endonuclease Cas3-HD
MTGLEKKTTEPILTTIDHILAKSDGEFLGKHTIGDLTVSKRLLENLPFYDQKLCDYLQLGITCHDIGKACTGFQKSLQPNSPRWGKRHEIISAVFATQFALPPEVIHSIICHHKDLSGEVKGCLNYEDVPFITN